MASSRKSKAKRNAGVQSPREPARESALPAARDEKQKHLRKPAPAKSPRSGPPESGTPNKFPIVGIGASAGGLEAFTELLKHLPLDSGMGFVLVQHLDPQHESTLTQLLARATSMPVREVMNNLRVEANHVYVIPPNTNLSIARGLLKLQPRPAGRALFRSIDSFFESLAQDRCERAIGVILSGTATDGTLGLEAIKAAGGITFAQDESARYDSMPRSAVVAGCVDFVLSPENIAKELAEIAKHPHVAGRGAPRAPGTDQPTGGAHGVPLPANESERATAGFTKIMALLRIHSGVDFSLYKSATLQRRATRRMVLNRQNSLDEYVKFLRGNSKELDALYSDCLLSVTSFFRNPEAFDVLTRKIFPRLLQSGGGDPLRIWVLGCSAGQEAYSIAMSLVEAGEKFPRAPKVQIFATDLNEALLDKARHGFYTKGLAQDLSPERLRQFFVEEQDGYRVNKQLREMVVFARLNLIDDPPFSRLDLISCRNLLIYLEPTVQKKALLTFHYALKPEGFLFLGASESVTGFTNLFEAVDKRRRIYSRKPVPTPAFHLLMKKEPKEISQNATKQIRGVPPSLSSLFSVNTSSSAPAELNAQREADRVTVNQFAPPGVLINAELQVLQFRGPTGAYLEPPTGKANFDLLKMAREGLMLPLRAAINKARKENKTARRENVWMRQNGQIRMVNIEVLPLKNLRERCFLVLFEDAEKSRHPGPLPSDGRAGIVSSRGRGRGPLKSREAGEVPPSPGGEGGRSRSKAESRRVAELETELAETRDYLQSIQEQHEAANEELQASNEEVTSANEELQSLNEELETSKEELESANEELTTMNDELGNRNAELHRLNDALKRSGQETKAARDYAEAALRTTRDPLLILRADLRVNTANETFYKAFKTTPDQTEGVLIYELGNGQWRIPKLRILLEDILPRNSFFNDFEVEHDFPSIGKRTMLLNARRLEQADGSPQLIFLGIEDMTERLESRAALKSSELRYRRLFEAAQDGVLILDSVSRKITDANPFMTELLGYAREEFLGKELWQLGFWKDEQTSHAAFRELQSRGYLRSDASLKTKDGQTIHVESLSNLYEEDHRKVIQCNLRDITARKQTEHELRQSDAWQRLLFESVRDFAIFSMDTEGRITNWNPGAERLFGYRSEEIVGQDVSILFTPEDRAARISEKELRGAQLAGFALDDRWHLRKDGGLFYASGAMRPLLDSAGNLLGYVKICRDITERMQAEKARVQLAAIVEFSDDAIISKDCEGIITSWNHGAERLFGYTAREAVGQPVTMLIPPDHLDEEPSILERIRRGESITHYETVRRRKDGLLLDISLTVSPIRNSAGVVVGASKVARDISHRKRNEEALRLAQAQLADRASQLERLVAERTARLQETVGELEGFAYSITHDLRAPLRAMQSFAQLLNEGQADKLDDAGRDFLRRIAQSAHRMDQLITYVLTYSRVLRLDLRLERVDVESLLRGMLESYPDFQEPKAAITVEGELPAVLGNQAALTQCFSNLLNNAVKFVAPGTKPVVRVWAEEAGQMIRLWVADNGIGIAERHLENIFGMFQRLETSYDGTGIGLAIVRKAVERMGGAVGVESEPGRGSRFWIELKSADNPAANA